MSMQEYVILKRREPYWFTKVRETFRDLIYDTKVEVLGIDIYRKITFNYDLKNGTTNKIVLDYYQKSFIKWRE